MTTTTAKLVAANKRYNEEYLALSIRFSPRWKKLARWPEDSAGYKILRQKLVDEWNKEIGVISARYREECANAQ